MYASIATDQPVSHLVEIRKRGLDKADLGMATQGRDLVRVPRSNHDLVVFLQQGLDHIVPDKTSSTCNEYTHKDLFLYHFLT